MSKIPKDQSREHSLKNKRKFEETFAYRTVIISTVLGIIFYVVSFLFNSEVIIIFSKNNLLLDLINILIKVVTILLFFLFMMISIGNFKELSGKPLDWKELLLLFILSLGQTILDSLVFTFTLLGLTILLIYLYVVQER
ncbi:hypothetical protein LCGC14_0492760 [marine sediment metagenome]|uniref:Uncharacterized protein n=1 Tax=marine sediment metagenome TaxID=412755 RepID=A0A0F9VEW8_9ZZZZ|nr:MAG: hypothetical protein Lokiarch_50830 [Candidatus Lokiarchaeum sp. GC14_75]